MSTPQIEIPAIVLAGGFGTRLSHILPDVPKPMAPVSGRPFLEILFDYLIEEGVRSVIVATGHMADSITDYFGDQYKELAVQYSHETTPLGTGGAIKQAMDQFALNEAIVLNGDTYFPVNLSHLLAFHRKFKAGCTISITNLTNFDRYGTISWNAYNQVEAFHEKRPCQEGWINGGIYLIDKKLLADQNEVNFSFETQVLESVEKQSSIFVLPSSQYFIDIGIPEDYHRFQQAFDEAQSFAAPEIQSVFVDRDGVINQRIPGDYVKQPDEFHFLPQAKDALKKLKFHFEHVLVITNQQGIGKGLMTRQQLDVVHGEMTEALTDYDAKPDAIYYCPELEVNRPACRKPNVGMAFQAKDAFPSIEWSRCAMIGDSTSDIEFGLRMGMYTILVGEKSDTNLAHAKCADLFAATNLLLSLSV